MVYNSAPNVVGPGWAGGNHVAQGQTIQPINWKIDRMIRDADAPHSATSEFFINLNDNPDFDFKVTDEDDVPGYCVFGEVVQGMEIIDRIAQLPTTSLGDFAKVPSPPVTIGRVERLQ